MTTPPNNDPGAEARWWVQVRGQAYGPYLRSQVAGFVAEGRVTGHTLVSNDPAGGWRTAVLAGLVGAERAPAAANDLEADGAHFANMVVWGDLPSGGEDHVDRTLSEFGAAGRVGPGLWVLRTAQPVAVIRAAIAAGLSVGERFLVVDANRGRLAWSNLGLDSETNLRRVWDGRG